MADQKQLTDGVFVQGMQEVNPDSGGMVYFPAGTSPDEIQRQIRTQLIPQLWKQNPKAMWEAHTTPAQQRAFQQTEESTKDPGFWAAAGSAAAAVPEVLGGMAETALEPGFNPVAPLIEYGKRYVKGSEELHQKFKKTAGQAYSDIAHGQMRKAKGELWQAGGEFLGQFMPSTYEAAQAATEDYFRGKPGQGVEEVTQMLAPYGIDAVLSLGSKGLLKAFGGRYTAQKAADVAAFQQRMTQGLRPGAKPQARLTYGQETGNRLVRNIERRIERTSAFSAPQQQAEEVVQEAQRQAGMTARRISPTSIPLGAGTPADRLTAASGAGLAQGIDNYHAANKSLADQTYTGIRQTLQANPETKTIGIQRLPNPNATPAGIRLWQATRGARGTPPFVHQIVQEVFYGPVPMKPIWGNRELQQFYQRLVQASWATREGTSPGWTALEDLMHPQVDPRTGRPVPWKNALDTPGTPGGAPARPGLDTDLGHLKRLVREASRQGYIDKQSRALLMKTISTMEKTLEPALNRVQPGLYGKLQTGRRYVQRYSKAEELKNAIMGNPARAEPPEPARLHRALTTPGDSKIQDAEAIRAMAPRQVAEAGRMELEYLAQKWVDPTTGDVANAKVAYSELMRLGPQTRALLFGGARNAREIESLFRTMGGFFPAVGSATWDNAVAWGIASGVVMTAAGVGAHLLGGDVLSAVGVAGKGMATAAGSWALTKFLFRTGNAGYFLRALTAAAGPARREALRQLSDRAMLSARQDKEEGLKAPEAEESVAPGAAAQPEQAAAPVGDAPTVGEAQPEEPPPSEEEMRNLPAQQRYLDPSRLTPASPTPPPAPPRPAGAKPSPYPQPRAQAAPVVRPAAAGATKLGAGLRPAWKARMIEAGEANGVPPSMLMAMANVESAGKVGAVSPKGARGLMQFMPDTAAEQGVDVNDPISSIDGAAKLMGYYLRIYRGDRRLALAAYNAGAGAVKKYKGIPPFEETRLYVQSVVSRMNAP